jgi:hypothetical protein
MRILCSQILDHLEQMADGAPQTIEPHDNKGVAGGDLAKQPGRGQGGRMMPQIRIPG